jgi:hypothetical protein
MFIGGVTANAIIIRLNMVKAKGKLLRESRVMYRKLYSNWSLKHKA